MTAPHQHLQLHWQSLCHLCRGGSSSTPPPPPPHPQQQLHLGGRLTVGWRLRRLRLLGRRSAGRAQEGRCCKQPWDIAVRSSMSRLGNKFSL